MNLNHLAIFHAVAEERNISRGAARLYISQPAVSKQLGELERRLGIRLFDRLPQGVRLTEAGELLYMHSRRLFAIEAEAERVLAELQGLQRGRLAVGASTTIGVYLLPEILARFHRQYPGIEIALEIANTDVIQHKLLAGAVDVGMTEGFVCTDELETEVFWEDEWVVIAAAGHSILREGTITVERLCQEPFVSREPGSGTRAVIEHTLLQKGLAMQFVMTLGSTEAIKRAVGAGAGLAIVSRLSILAEKEAGKLTLVPVSDMAIRRPLHRLHLRGKYATKALMAFDGLLSQELKRLTHSHTPG